MSEGAVIGSGAGAVVIEITILPGQNLRLLHAEDSDHFTLKMLAVQCSDEISSDCSSCGVRTASFNITSRPHYTTLQHRHTDYTFFTDSLQSTLYPGQGSVGK